MTADFAIDVDRDRLAGVCPDFRRSQAHDGLIDGV